MWRKILAVSLLFLLFLNFCYATKLVFIPSSNPQVLNTDRSFSLNKNVQHSIIQKKDLKNYRIVNDSEYERLIKRNKKIKVLSDINLQKIKPFQKNSMPSIDANYIWSKGFTGNGVKIGLVDSGISYNASYANRISDANDFTNDINVECIDPIHHGCLVSSVLAGNPTGDWNDYNGVVYDANLVSAKIFNSKDHVPDDVNILDVFDWVVSKGARYINNSWGTPKYDAYCNPLDVNSDGNGDALWWDFYDYNSAQHNKEILFVFAAGNDGNCNTEKTLSNDAAAYNVLSVGAIYDMNNTDRNDDVYAFFSSRGPTDDGRKKPDLVAPGHYIVSQGLTGWYRWSGTSAAAPHVTGSAALLSQLGLNPLRVKALLINSADDINASGWDKYTGWGYINLKNAYDENSFVKEYDLNLEDSFYDFNSYKITIENPKSDFFVLSPDQNTKCTIVWRRVFDNNGYPFVQNYDLFLKKSDKNILSNSTKDNVEQVNLSNANTSAHLKVSCLGQCYSDINYALACNDDFNKINLDYYPFLDTNFYVPNGDGNFSFVFDFNSPQKKDLNVNLFSLLHSNYFSDHNDLNDFNLNNQSLVFKLNSDLNDVNKLYLDTNIGYLDYNTIVSTDLDINILALDSNSPNIITEASENYYLLDYNSNLIDYNIDDNFLYLANLSLSLDSNVLFSDLEYTNANDKNTINLQYDLNNLLDYNQNKKYVLTVDTKDIFGHETQVQSNIYSNVVPYILNSYVDFDNNVLYYKNDLNDLNIIFVFNPDSNYMLYLLDQNEYDKFNSCAESSEWYVCYDFNNNLLDVNTFSFSKSDNLFYYDFNLDNNYFIAIKNIDTNSFTLPLRLLKDPIPQFITTSTTKDFNILVRDNDLNTERISVSVDGSPVAVNVVKDGNDYYIAGVGSSSYATHYIDVNVFDYVENLATKSYSYIISRPNNSSGGSSGHSNSNLNNQTTENIQNKEIKEIKTENKESKKPKPLSQYTFDDINKLKDKGIVVLDTKFKPVLYLYNHDTKKLKYVRVKIFDKNKMLYSGIVINAKLPLDSNKFYDKNLLIFGYIDNILVIKKNVFVPLIEKKAPISNIDHSKIVPLKFDVNSVKKQVNNSDIVKTKYINIIVLCTLFVLMIILFHISLFLGKK